MTDILRQRPGYALRRAANAMMGELARRLGTIDLRIAEASVLLLVDRREDATASEIGRVLDIQRANMVPLLSRLEDAGLIERNHPGEKRKSGRQVTFSSDLIYDVLKRHEPDHILLRATRADAARGLTDVRRVADLLERAKGRITLKVLDRVSPLAVPVLLEIGRESVWGEARDHLLAEAEEALVREATGVR